MADVSCYTDYIEYDRVHYVSSKEDVSFAESHGLSEVQLNKMIDAYEKLNGRPIVMEKSHYERLLLFPEMLTRVNEVMPNFQIDLKLDFKKVKLKGS